ncbi:DNA endonuclease [Oxynema aestuarii]|jgi:hypothetical protein|uniref:DNA endonuclease n=1 Tax=Oxynema aestuarii AP17 TaxID=2064643 RepID=A0A6H1TUA5_9CYAN|nr:DNA endonuclease [Oxynema aestuarii]QIZ69727.1 DNA endonuclease [Oxynema aestuarii AP17]RMH72503.1 MAG: DNA endonuclease [Cyanobacteria bacterium J007]
MDYNVSSKIEQRGILTGMLLGHAKRRKENFFIVHGDRQQGYLAYKQEILEAITRKRVGVRQRFSRRGRVLVYLEPKSIPLTRVLVQRLYQGKRKTIARPFLNGLTPAGIAIWFLDRGSKSFKRHEGKIKALEIVLNTRLSPVENEQVITYFSEVWGFEWGLKKIRDSWGLRMGTREGKRFLEFIAPYVPESMLYKIQTTPLQT